MSESINSKMFGPYYIIQKLDKTYLTYNKQYSTANFQPLKPKSDQESQKWFINEFREVNTLIPFNDREFRLCMDNSYNLSIKPKTIKSRCIYWYINDYFDHVFNGQVYENQLVITNLKFPEKNLFNNSSNEEYKYLTISYKSPRFGPIFAPEKPVISYDFDGVLHFSVLPDHRFYKDILFAIYHPIDFHSSNLVPNQELLNQMVKDSHDHQIIIVTARPSSSDKVVRKYLKDQGVDKIVDHIFYISDKTTFLKKLGAKLHYDDSPKHVLRMQEAGVPVVAVTPKINTFWLSSN